MNQSEAKAKAHDDVEKDTNKDESKEDEKKEQDLGPDYSYDSNGVLVYTDPESKREFVLNADKTDWVAKDEAEQQQQPNYDFDGKTYSYRDDKTGKKFRWDLEKKEWAAASSSEESEMSDSDEERKLTPEEREKKRLRKRKAAPGWGKQTNYMTDPDTGVQLYRDEKDGMLYEWDKEKNAWFPRIDDDFMAQYQLNYGFTKDGKAEPTKPEEPPPEEAKAKKAKTENQPPAKAKWFEEDEAKTTKVYVSNLPADTTEESFEKFMTKCGMVDVDVRSGKPKLKLYRDSEGNVKGDGLCTYVKVESVGLALQILDGATLGSKEVKVERAKFEMKGDKYDPKLKPKKLRKKELEALKRKHEKMFAWAPDKLRGERSKRDKVIVVRNLFDPDEFVTDATRILEYSSRLREQCSKFGSVGKVVVYDKHPEGIAQVFFRSPEEADLAISMMNGRMFNQRVMKAETWNGKEKFKVEETEEEEQERLSNWDKFLNEEEEEEENTEVAKNATAEKATAS